MTKNQFILISIIAWGIGGIFTKLASNELTPVMMSIITTGIYMVALPIIVSVYKLKLAVSVAGFGYAIASSIGLGVGSLSYMFALQKGEAGSTTAATAVYPVITMMLSFLFLSEEMTFKKAIGCMLAVTSVYLLTNK